MQFLGLQEVLEIHRDQVSRYGGTAGIRDLGLLKSALGMPGASFNGEFLHTDAYEMAAAYLFHLIRKHPLLDGNKRVGAVAALVFLALNGHDFQAPEDLLKERRHPRPPISVSSPAMPMNIAMITRLFKNKLNSYRSESHRGASPLRSIQCAVPIAYPWLGDQ